MSIYIKGMEMPKNCFDCPLFDDVYTDADGDDDYRCGLGVPLDYYQASGKAKKDCPLIAIPEHGDLVDKDELKKQMSNLAESYGWWFVLCNAPTIIPASEEGE